MNLFLASQCLLILFSCSLLIQTLEYFRLLPFTDQLGVWSWQIQKSDIPLTQRTIRSLLDALLDQRGYKVLLALRLVTAASLPLVGVTIWGSWFLLISNLLLLVRWRGAFNGGSDFMTLVLTCGLVLGQTCGLWAGEAMGWVISMWYVSIHSITSYFMSGWVKLIKKEWVTGVCMPIFVNTGVYGPLKQNSWLAKKPIAILCSWSFILWEALMPLALLSPELSRVFCSVALVFHFLVFWFFGLNRFFWAWAASLPAILYCSTWVWS